MFQVCLKLSRNEGIKKWDAERQVPYLVAGNQWIGYDDEDSFAAKVSHHANWSHAETATTLFSKILIKITFIKLIVTFCSQVRKTFLF